MTDLSTKMLLVAILMSVWAGVLLLSAMTPERKFGIAFWGLMAMLSVSMLLPGDWMLVFNVPAWTGLVVWLVAGGAYWLLDWHRERKAEREKTPRG